MKLRIFSALGLLASFFMPWLDLTFTKVSGYEFARLQRSMPGMIESRYYAFLFFLIPAFCVAIIIVELSKRSTRSFAGLVGLYSFIMIFSFIINDFENIVALLQLLDFGYYVALVASACLVFSARNDGRKRKRGQGLTNTQRAYREQMKRHY